MAAHRSAHARALPAIATPSGDLAPLDLQELRRHRLRLSAEEDRISYWRRLTSARIDALDSGSKPANSLTFAQLERALGDTATGRARRALQVAAVDLPELPHLSHAWTTSIEAGAHQQVAFAVDVLAAADKTLDAYEVALHDLIDDALRELILRYRENPMAALDALPER